MKFFSTLSHVHPSNQILNSFSAAFNRSQLHVTFLVHLFLLCWVGTVMGTPDSASVSATAVFPNDTLASEGLTASLSSHKDGYEDGDHINDNANEVGGRIVVVSSGVRDDGGRAARLRRQRIAYETRGRIEHGKTRRHRSSRRRGRSTRESWPLGLKDDDDDDDEKEEGMQVNSERKWGELYALVIKERARLLRTHGSMSFDFRLDTGEVSFLSVRFRQRTGKEEGAYGSMSFNYRQDIGEVSSLSVRFRERTGNEEVIVEYVLRDTRPHGGAKTGGGDRKGAGGGKKKELTENVTETVMLETENRNDEKKSLEEAEDDGVDILLDDSLDDEGIVVNVGAHGNEEKESSIQKDKQNNVDKAKSQAEGKKRTVQKSGKKGKSPKRIRNDLSRQGDGVEVKREKSRVGKLEGMSSRGSSKAAKEKSRGSVKGRAADETNRDVSRDDAVGVNSSEKKGKKQSEKSGKSESEENLKKVSEQSKAKKEKKGKSSSSK